MTTYESDKVAAEVPARETLGVTSQSAEFALSAALVANDIIEMFTVPKNARIIDLVISSTDLDTGGAPALVLEVGDGADTDRFIAASTIGQAGGVARLNAHSGVLYRYAAKDTIDVKVATGPATGATSGTIRGTVLYDMQK